MRKEYYNENRRNVTDYIEHGLTLVFENLFEAIKRSLELNTYHYELFTLEWDKELQINELKFIGYGVPRK